MPGLPTLDQLGVRYSVQVARGNRGGDKASTCQDYLEKYGELFERYREGPTSILEIGIFQGKSLALWADYFRQGEVWGVDIDLSNFEGNRKALDDAGCFSNPDCKVVIKKGDSTRAEGVKALDLPQFDIIIDDGDHQRDAQQRTFDNLFFTHLKPGGVYVVEDMHNNPSFKFFATTVLGSVYTFDQPGYEKIQTREGIQTFLKNNKNRYTRHVASVEFIRRRVIIHKHPW